MSRSAQQLKEPIDDTPKSTSATVFSSLRTIQAPALELSPELKPNTRLKMEGLEFLALLPEDSIPVAFFDPQYRGVLEKLAYGNEGKERGRRRCALEQMSEAVIGKFVRGIAKALTPSGHLFLWVDKFHLCQGINEWRDGTGLEIVDMLTWDKGTFGMGYRTRRRAEHCIILQKPPRKAKGVWKVHNIPDVVRSRFRSASIRTPSPLVSKDN